jgi:hypothetical protein
MTPESLNSEAGARHLLMSNDEVNIKFQLQRLAKTRFRGNEYAGITRSVLRRLSYVLVAMDETE